jgi:hypothetical protein
VGRNASQTGEIRRVLCEGQGRSHIGAGELNQTLQELARPAHRIHGPRPGRSCEWKWLTELWRDLTRSSGLRFRTTASLRNWVVVAWALCTRRRMSAWAAWWRLSFSLAS